jgi:hypothetical protein
MPYRDFPQSNAGYLKALDAALTKWNGTAAAARLVSAEQFSGYLDLAAPPAGQPGSVHFRFKKELGESASALAAQTPLTTALDTTRGLLRLTISHFIQTLNNAITRSALPREARTLYQLPLESDRVPDLFTDADLLLWSQRIADGEKARTDAGGPPIAWPSAAEVATVRAQFSTQAAAQSSAKDATAREQGDVERLLPEVAAAVKDLWDTVEFHLRHEPTPASLRRRAREWGITYATRPGETPDEGATPTNPTQPAPANPA